MKTHILALAASLTAKGETFAVATVVRREAPSSAHLGDTAIITRDGRLHGFIGGSCTRSTVVHQALEVLADRKARLISFRDDDPRADDIVSVPMTCHSGGSVEIYIDPVFPAPRLLLLGSSPVNQALAGLGAAMGYDVRLAGLPKDGADAPPAAGTKAEAANAAFATDDAATTDDAVLATVALEHLAQLAERDEGTLVFALVATMGESDEDMLEAALAARPDYLGVIASRRRMEEVRTNLKGRGAPAEAIDTIDGPAGLDIGATRPEEIAVSILAKIVAVRRQADTTARSADPSGSSTRAPASPSSTHASASPARRRSRRESPGERAIDPVCGMSVSADESQPNAEHDGRTYWFCCDGCRERFLENPEPHLATAGVEDSWGDGESA